MKTTAVVCIGVLFSCLGAVRADEADTLIANVADKNQKWMVRRTSAWKLIRSGEKKAIPLFKKIIDDKDENINMTGIACVAMGKFGVKEKVPRLIELLKEARAIGGRPAYALAKIKDKRVIPALMSGGSYAPRALHYYVTRTDKGNRKAIPYLKRIVKSGKNLETPLATLEFLIGEKQAAKLVPLPTDITVTVDKAVYKRPKPKQRIPIKISIKNISDKPHSLLFHGSPYLSMFIPPLKDSFLDIWCIEIKKSSKPLKPAGQKGFMGPKWAPLNIDPKETITLECLFFPAATAFGLGPEGEYVNVVNPECRVAVVHMTADGKRYRRRSYSRKFALVTKAKRRRGVR